MQGRLEEVAAVLVEFYEGADHGAKPALNERLGDMRSRANAWRDALWWLGATADLGATPATYYVSYFSASVLEEAVRVGFGSEQLGREGRVAVRAALFAPEEPRSVLLAAARNQRATLPAAVATRLRKVVVDVGKAAWPGEMPNYLQEICLASMEPDAGTSTLGLELLALTAEEFCDTNGKVAMSRSRELKSHLGTHLTQIVGLLCEALRRADGHDAARDAALRCLSTLVAWAPLASHMTPDLLATLFGIVERDVARSPELSGGLEAARCLDAVLLKRLVPPNFSQFVVMLSQHTLSLLRTLAAALEAKPAGDVDDDFEALFAAVSELVATFVEQHFPRVATTDCGFPVAELLGLLAKVLFSPPANPRELRRGLRPWDTLIAFLAESEDASLGDPGNATGAGVASVVLALFRDRLLFATNGDALSLLDEEEAPETGAPAKADEADSAAELVDELSGGAPDARALGGCLPSAAHDGGELRLLLADGLNLMGAACRGVLRPHVAGPLCEAAAAALEASLAGAFPPLEALEHGVPRSCVRCAVDAATACGVLGAAAPLAGDDDALASATRAALNAANGCLRERAHALGPAYAALECAALDALRDLVPAVCWRSRDGPGGAEALVDGALDAAALALDCAVSPPPDPVARAGAWLILAVAKCAKGAPWLLRNARLTTLAAGGCQQFTRNAGPRSRALVYRGAAAVHLLSEDPAAGLRALLEPVAAPVLLAARALDALRTDAELVSLEALDAAALSAAQRGCRVLAALAAGATRDDYARSLVSRAFFPDGGGAFHAALAGSTRLLAHSAARALATPQLGRDAPPQAIRGAAALRAPHLALATSIVELLVAASHAFGHAAGGCHALRAVGALLVAFDATPPAKILLANSAAYAAPATLGSPRPPDRRGSAVAPPRAAALYLVKATCKLVSTVAAAQGAEAARAVPDVCDLALNHVAPLAGGGHAPELLPPLLDLADHLLCHQWAAFVAKPEAPPGSPAGVALQYRSAPPTLRDGAPARHFRTLCDLLAVGVAGVDLPPHAVKRALRALSNANAKSRLFDFAVFSAEFRAKLCDRLLDALLDRRHDLLCDDLAAVLHALAAADLDGFFGSFVPAKLQNAPGLDDAQRRAVLAGWGRAPDAPSFVANLNDAVNDVAFYRLQNLHAME